MKLPKLVVLDVDGVLTDGTKTYVDGKPVSKRFYDKDFTAIKLLKAKGIKVCFLTADESNQALAKDRNIDCFLSRDERNKINKYAVIVEIERHYCISRKDMWGVGDDIFDIEWLVFCGMSFCPADAWDLLCEAVDEVLFHRGGKGVVVEIVERFLPIISLEDIDKLKEIDSEEGWSHTTR
jgi:3-deoxy-D-manno-octulosonate 8-phosphate phosphatase (KDO 8-P phosphatase)